MSLSAKSGRDVSGVLSKAGLVMREPIVMVNLVSALLLEVCILLRQFGVPLTDGQVDAINAVAGLLLLIAAAVLGRTLTTPLADPRDKLGQPLTPDVPVDELGAAASRTFSVAGATLDARPLPIEDDVAKQLPTTPPTPSDGGGDDPIGGRRRTL